MSFTQITLTAGTLKDPNGDPATGFVRIRLNSPMKNSGDLVDAATVVINFADGAFVGGPFAFPANDDVDTTPNGPYYRFTLQIQGAPRQTFDAMLHANAPDATVKLSDLIPVRAPYIALIDGGAP